MDVQPYLARRFDLARQNCWHMARDAWRELTGLDLGDRTPEAISHATLLGKFDSDVPAFTQLGGPQDPCLVLMERRRFVPHVGVYLRRRVLQMTRHGASFVPLDVATAGFDRVGFYR